MLLCVCCVHRVVAFDWMDMLQHVIALHQPFADRKSLPILVQTEENVPRWILGVLTPPLCIAGALCDVVLTEG